MKRLLPLMMVVALGASTACVSAQSSPGHVHHDGTPMPMPTPMPMASAPAASAVNEPLPTDRSMDMSHDMPMSGMDMAPMQSAFGIYPMAREGSGTSWQPDATPMDMLHTMRGGWMLMLHGYANVIHDHQGGPRGDDKTFTESMLMGMASHPLGSATLGFKGMVSLDPTMGKSGYPLLFQTGETADGMHPLVDRQHPHDALMELSTSLSQPVPTALGEEGAVFVYAGLPGEPALGPPTFMHRASGMRNPEAPLTHHWFDSTHITFGVVTAGASQGPLKLEGSWFNGREPDQQRWNLETRGFDSWSTRLSLNPTREWSLQTSYGYLKSPEQLEPTTSVRRLTASAIWQTTLAGQPWATTLAWSRNDKRGPEGRSVMPGAFVESTWNASDADTVFGRIERVSKDELFDGASPLRGSSFKIAKFSLGYVRDVTRTGPIRWGIGGVIGAFRVPSALDASYGSHPRSFMLFLQGRLAPL